METVDRQKAIGMIEQAQSIVFLTGAGISTASGIPDYRSLAGAYQGIEHPEYLLSHTCLINEPEKFYSFVQTLYHPTAEPNIVHLRIAELEKSKNIWVISQNIDGLHAVAGTQHLVNFHGNLYDCYCQKCGRLISAKEYLRSDYHEQCGGQIRPNIVLYEEGLDEQTIKLATEVIAKAELIVIVGTSFQVHPFCDLIHYAADSATILVINQTLVHLNKEAYFLKEKAEEVFKNT